MFRKGASISNALGQLTRKSNRVFLTNMALRPLSYTTTSKMVNPSPSSQSVDSTNKPDLHRINHPPKRMTSQQLHDALAHCQSVGNVKGAVKLVTKAQETNMATVATYDQLLETILSAPLDVDSAAAVAAWFYLPQSTLPSDIKSNVELWHNVMKLGFRLASTHRREDLRVLVESFTSTFDLATLDNQDSWGLLLRAYGILNQPDRISALMTSLTTQPQYTGLDRRALEEAAVLAYAATSSYEKMDELVRSLEKEGTLDQKLLLKLTRNFGFAGDVERTQYYSDLCHQLYPDSGDTTTMLMIAHRAALHNQYLSLVKTRGTSGLPLKPPTGSTSSALDDLHASWDALITANKDNLANVAQCNVMIEYLALANVIDPEAFPLSKAQRIVDEYMPAHNIKPDKMIWNNLLRAYATTAEFSSNTKHNVRLDKALEILARMDGAGFHANQASFHALFKACLPHRPDRGYIYDHFSLASRMTTTVRPYFDARVFDLERIMLAAKIPHDRTTIKLMMTCLGATGKYQAMWNRWRLLKMTGVRRDAGLYQHVFSLASMDPEQSQYALSVTRNELAREIAHGRIPWDTYVAMLDCAITSRMPDMATLIINEMRRREPLLSPSSQPSPSSSSLSPNDDSSSSPPSSSHTRQADLYIPLLRAYATIPALAPEVPKLLNEMKSKQITYNNTIWQIIMSYHLLHDDAGAIMQNVQDTFNAFTMQRLETKGRIPIPVRSSSPIIPFPSAPYSATDMSMINMYVTALLDAQDVSLVFDVLRLMQTETPTIHLSRETLRGVVKLAKQEKSHAELSWFVHHLLPTVSSQNANFKQWCQHLQDTVPK